MIQTLEAEIDEKGSVRFNQPVYLDRKHRVLVMVMPDEPTGSAEDNPEGWDRPYVEHPYRVLPAADDSSACTRRGSNPQPLASEASALSG